MKRHIRYYFRRARRCLRQFIFHTILHADDPPEIIARGIAIGMFVAILPAIGMQTVLSLFFAWLLRANKAVGLPIVWFSNPATMMPILWLCYFIGQKILGTEEVDTEYWQNLAHPPAGWWPGVTFYWDRFMQIAWPLWVGSFVLGAVVAWFSYYLSYWAIYTYRMKRWGQLLPPRATKHGFGYAHAHAHGHDGQDSSAAPQPAIEETPQAEGDAA